MEQLFRKKLDDAIKTLENLQRRDLVCFKIFVGEDEEYGDLEVVREEKKRKKSPSVYPHGAVRDYVLPFIEPLKFDEIVSIPFAEFDAESLRGNVCAWATTKWGKGSYSTTVNREAQTVEIYRHAE